MLVTAPLTDVAIDPYLAMTYPLYRPVLRAAGQDANVIALGATCHEAPVGLALAQVPATGGPTPVRSLYVAPAWRGKGIGGALLDHMEDELRARGLPRVWLTYLRDKPSTPVLEHLLARRGWDQAIPRMLHLTTSAPSISRAPWLRFDRFPAGFTAFPWDDLSAAERDRLERAGWIPPELLPSRWGEGYDRRISLGLCYRGDVVGWLIVHEIAPGTVRLSTGWVRPDLQRGMRVPPFVPLCIAALRRAQAAGMQQGVWDIARHQEAMTAFARKWLLPYADSVRETMITGKFL